MSLLRAASPGCRCDSESWPCTEGHTSGSVLCQAVPVLLQGTMIPQRGWGAATSEDQALEGPSARRQVSKCWPGRKPRQGKPSPQGPRLEEAVKSAENRKAELESGDGRGQQEDH